MARPFLADPDFVAKAAAGKADEINTCIGCNQACLDHTFGGKITSCLVNPRACHETLLVAKPLAQIARIAVVGAGPAGLAFSTEAARRGFDVTLIDAAIEIGGQFNVAKQVPGKEEFFETLRYFGKQIELTGVKLQLGRKVSAQDLVGEGYRHVVLATGVNPRLPDIEGIGHPKVLGYLEVLRDKKPVGKTVALIGAGGIGFDVAEFLLAEGTSPSLDTAKFFAEWGVDATGASRGGLAEAHVGSVPRKVYLLQRKVSKVGDGLGKGFPLGAGEAGFADLHEAQSAGQGGVEAGQLRHSTDLAGVGDAHRARQAQRLEDRTVGRQHRSDAHRVGVLPAQRGVYAVVEFAFPVRHLEKVQADVGVFIDVLAGDPRPRNFHTDAEFFVEFADQRVAGAFSGFDFAAGEFPVAGIEGVGCALAEEDASVGPGYHRGGDVDDLAVRCVHASKRPA